MHIIIFTTLSLLFVAFSTPLHAQIQDKEIQYSSGGVNFQGYLAWDDSIADKRPGVLVVHEWWGHNEYARKRARMLAKMGYVALALDMYGEGKQAKHPKDAGKFSSAVMAQIDVARNRFEAAMLLLQQQTQTDADHIAAIGYCFGGGVVLHMARLGVKLDAVASFHGSLSTKHPAKKGSVLAKLAVFNGEEDPFVSADSIVAFKKEMKVAGAELQFTQLAGAKHSFTNPEADSYGQRFQLPLAYHAKADQQSWKMLEKFLLQSFATNP